MSQLTRVIPASETADFNGLLRLITQSGSHPLDVSHVAAMLELNGFTDRRAATLGYDDVFDLAAALFHSISADNRREEVLDEEKDPWFKRLFRIFRLYLRGLSFAAPMILSSASVLALRYSLWSYIDFSTEIATAIALATFGSFLVTGGFTQAIARRGLFYITQDQYKLARLATFRLVMVGVAAIAVFIVGMGLFVAVVPILTWGIVGVTYLYFVPMAFIWLGTGLLYMLHWEPVILGLIAVGIFLVYVLFERFHVPMMVAQAVTMTVVAAGSFGLAVVLFRNLEHKNVSETEQKIRMRWSQTSRSLMPFFVYGVAYFALNFADRLMAWSRPEEFHPYFIWFRGDYELGLDWALWSLFVPMGLVEIYVVSLFDRLKKRGKHTNVANLPKFNRGFQVFHLRTIVFVLLGGLAGIPAILWLVKFLFGHGWLVFNPMLNQVTNFTFFVAAPSFSILATGLQGALVLFSFNEPWMATRAAGWALLANVLVGFLASRYVAYWWAVLGLAVGAIVFATLTTRQALHVLGRLDYYMMRGT